MPDPLRVRETPTTLLIRDPRTLDGEPDAVAQAAAESLADLLGWTIRLALETELAVRNAVMQTAVESDEEIDHPAGDVVAAADEPYEYWLQSQECGLSAAVLGRLEATRIGLVKLLEKLGSGP